MNNFKTGDVVTLKSGGPKMTIYGQYWNHSKGINEQDKFTCYWFDKDDKLMKGDFKADMLEIH